MLKVTEVQCRLGISFPETEFHCPHCQVWMRFYSVSAKVCAICGETLPNVAKMKHMRGFRLQYHWGGYIHGNYTT